MKKIELRTSDFNRSKVPLVLHFPFVRKDILADCRTRTTHIFIFLAERSCLINQKDNINVFV